jgi:hypothetical protein
MELTSISKWIYFTEGYVCIDIKTNNIIALMKIKQLN